MSVNRGAVAPFTALRRDAASAIDKRPVTGPVAVTVVGIEGDEQFERRIHGGPNKAVYAYAAEDLHWWSQQLGLPLPPGFIGEKLTTAKIDLNALHPGDELHTGSVILRVTGPRAPCAKLAARVGVSGFERRFGRAGRMGVYCAVVHIGTLAGGAAIRVRSGERTQPSIRAMATARYGTDA